MPWDLSSGDARRANRGSALVIVLFFVILLTALTIAFLSRSLTASKVSASSANETKVNLLANSAGDIVIGDLKQEIVAGSALSGTVNWPVYTPNSNLTMIPFLNGGPASSTAIPNLISRSVSPSNTGGANPYIPYPTALYTAASVPPNRAAVDPTATGTYTSSKVNTSVPSLNGRFVSAAQWNSHYLIPRNTTVDAAGSLSTDSTPIGSFVPPDWVVVTRGGATSVSWTSTLTDPTITNTGYAVGRYAYAVYNEGGLLDMNVAGFPNDPTNPGAAGSNGLTTAQASGKGSLALADLTQLVAGAALTQTQINNLVGWRNYATAQLSSSNGTYGSFAFTPATATDWLNNFVLTNTNGFMKTIAPAGVTTPPSDQAFQSRQQLITLAQSLQISPDFLQYMGTFSRSLEQPSFVPDPKRPTILLPGTLPPAVTAADSYVGNNDNAGKDSSASSSVNPAFLSIRISATGTYTRFDNTPAVVGEPLVKHKFPLSRLAYVAYNATNATVKTNTTITTTKNPDPILDWFGLTRTSATSPWVYSHGSSSKILTLAQVGTLKRDPDFAELLKAAICAGSVAKGGPNLSINGPTANLQYVQDTTSDAQILQIMANLIDQQDTDSYPTRISISNGSLGTITVSGIEDLPYFYRYHIFSVVDTQPVPLISGTSTPTFPVPTGISTLTTTYPPQNYPAGTAAAPYSETLSYSSPVTVRGCVADSTPLTNQGEGTLFLVADMWNPHDPNNVNSSATLRPAKFRIYLATVDPYSNSSLAVTNPWTLNVESTLSTAPLMPENNGTNPVTIYYYPISAGASYTAAGAVPLSNNTLTFSDDGGKLFREPTLLWNTVDPPAAGLSGPVVTDINTKQKYCGIILGKAPISQQFKITSTPANLMDGTYIVQASQMQILGLQGIAPSNNNQLTAFVQYQDPNDPTGNTWTTYDTKYFDFHNNNFSSLVVNTADYPDGSWQSPLKNGQFQCFGTCMDPRTDRWGVGDAAPMGNYPTATAEAGGTTQYVLEPNVNTLVTTGSYTSLKSTYFSVVESNRPRADPGNVVWYSNPCMTSDPNPPLNTTGLRNLQMRWFSVGEYRHGSTAAPGGPAEFDGLFSQNNPNISSTLLSQNAATVDSLYYEDPDGVARRASGSYTDTTLTDSSTSSMATTSTFRTGMPMATASTFPANDGVASPTSQSQARPLILNRPFRSVAEMSYAFRGSPWKNIDFFNPESGDSALLDAFCVNEIPSNGLVAGKVDLNTRNAPVLQAVVGGAYQDEDNNNASTPTSYALPSLSGGEAAKVASTLTGITSDTTHAWRGPLLNTTGLVGRYIASPGTTSGYSDFYTYAPPSPVSGQAASVTYAGLSAALDCSQINGAANHVYASASAPVIQRFRESALRPLADAGQVRVWNLLIDLVVQTGKYPKTATGFDQFLVDGEKRVWIHVAIDRLTGQVLDKQVEVVTP